MEQVWRDMVVVEIEDVPFSELDTTIHKIINEWKMIVEKVGLRGNSYYICGMAIRNITRNNNYDDMVPPFNFGSFFSQDNKEIIQKGEDSDG